MKKSFPLAACVLLLSCEPAAKKQESQPVYQFAKSYEKTVEEHSDTVRIEGGIGFVVPNEKYSYGDSLNIMNDGKIIEALAEDEDGNVIALKCREIRADHYVVYLGEDINDTGSVNRHTENVKFQTWEQHMLDRITFVDFDTATNPLRSEPKDNAPQLRFNSDDAYSPLNIKGEWMKVQGGDDEPGWIKWRDGDRLLIGYSYRC